MSTSSETEESEAHAITDSELPVRPHLRCQDDRDLGLALGAPAAGNKAVLLCRNAIVLSLIEAMQVGCVAVHYSRNHNPYSLKRAQLPTYWTYRYVMRAIDELTV